MLERYYPVIISLALTFFVCYIDFNLGKVANYKEIMSSAISLGSIAVGFLAAAITLMPSLSNNELVKNLKAMGAYKKLLEYIISAIFGLFTVSLLSIIALFLSSSTASKFNMIFYHFWIFVASFAILSTYRVIRNFLKFLVLTQSDDD
jgi:hypothetical protein